MHGFQSNLNFVQSIGRNFLTNPLHRPSGTCRASVQISHRHRQRWLQKRFLVIARDILMFLPEGEKDDISQSLTPGKTFKSFPSSSVR